MAAKTWTQLVGSVAHLTYAAPPGLTLPKAPPPSPILCIASYNVMADVFSPPKPFPRHTPEWVSWLYCGPCVAEEIAQVKPDILCMQELGVDEEGAHIRPLLASRGYHGVFKPNAWKEGCAVFWRKEWCVAQSN